MREQKLSFQDLINSINKNTVLFLDRDGVINHRIPNDYVKRWEDFIFLPKAKEAIKIFTSIFSKIFVVTNQQGIGKGLMTEDMLAKVHQQMLSEIEKAEGEIKKVYYAIERHSSNPINRKPGIGMALKAKANFPEIELSNAIMIGDSESDIAFGYNAGMKTIFVENHPYDKDKFNIIPDFYASSLYDVAEFFQSTLNQKAF